VFHTVAHFLFDPQLVFLNFVSYRVIIAQKEGTRITNAVIRTQYLCVGFLCSMFVVVEMKGYYSKNMHGRSSRDRVKLC